MSNRKILIMTIALLWGGAGLRNASAVPAIPKPTVFTQSDGTQITVRTYGDEYHHYTLSEEGYTLTGGADGDFYYARLAADGTLEPTDVKALPLSRLNTAERAIVAKLRKGIRPTAVSPLRQMRRAAMQKSPGTAQAPVSGIQPPDRISSTATTGQQKWPIILVQFTDIRFTVSDPVSSISNLLNQQGYSLNGSTGSARDYYYQNSNGQFSPEFDVYGPYTVSNRASYYAGPTGTARVAELLIEVCRLADRDIDFSNYRENGYIKDVILFYAGHNQAEGAANTIWPHCSDVSYYNTSFDGVRLAGYGCFSELRGASGSSMANIGTFCHEFGHIMGWPDFYDTDYDGSGGQAPALENFSLMCSGSYNNESRTPPTLNILERWMMGWATPEDLTATGNYTLDPVTEDRGYLIRTERDNEYFLAEYRGAGGNTWDNSSHIRASGLIVYHVDYSSGYASRWQANTLNNSPSHECMKLVRSVPESSDNPTQTFFPGSRNITTLTASGNSLYRSWAGEKPVAEFSSIAVSGGAVRLTVQGEGTLKPDIDLNVSAGQYCALLTWTDPQSESWTVQWKMQQTSSEQMRAVRQSSIYLEGLTPGSTYEVTITPTPGGSEMAQTYTFATEATGDGMLRMVLPRTELRSDTPITLDIADYPGELRQLQWYIDGSLSTSAYRTLNAGEHTIMAVITAADGTREYLIKYITVK